ncbi:MAG TPA: pitrilysin family protein [Candidatus Krumholzibacteria bacterium]|nr:pitrilysin family protein [Candidatus Krumholzibacteria bacterium]
MHFTATCRDFFTAPPRVLPGVLAVLLAAGAPGGAMAKDVFPYTPTVRSLDNGLKVVMVPFDSPGIVAYYTIVRAGSRNEVEPGKSGFAHFFEHMMFRGTDRFSNVQYNALFRELGSDVNAYTSDDVTVYHAIFGSDGLEKVIDVESDRFMNLKYSESDFKQESRAVLGEYNKNYSDPQNKLYERVRETAFSSHTYKHTTMGFLDDIKDMPNQYAYSLEFFRRYYSPSNCVVLVVGDIDVDETFALIGKYYGGWKVPPYSPEIPAEPEQKEARTSHIDWENPTLPYVAVAFKVPAFSEKTRDSAAMDILSELLFASTSPLYQALVVDEQKVDDLEVYLPSRRDAGLMIVFARVKDAADMDEVRDRIYQTAAGAATTPADATRLTAVKSNIRYSFAMSLGTAQSVARHLTFFIGLTGDPASINEMYRRYDEITPQDLQSAAARYLTRARSTVVTLTGGSK